MQRKLLVVLALVTAFVFAAALPPSSASAHPASDGKHHSAPAPSAKKVSPNCSTDANGVCTCPLNLSAAYCNGRDPIAAGCADGSQQLLETASMTLNDPPHTQVGTVRIYWSQQCQSNWGVIDTWLISTSSGNAQFLVYSAQIARRSCSSGTCTVNWSRSYSTSTIGQTTHFYTDMAYAPTDNVQITGAGYNQGFPNDGMSSGQTNWW